ncbi:MAG: S8 family serine peptidase, partial [Gemmatimonadales bacterium]
SNNGSGVHFYGIDTGILYSHVDFGGRASPGFDAITSGGGAVDCNGHGTHTATTAAGTTYGVAKGMTVVGVRVLNCAGSGTFAQVIAGIDWVTANAIKPAVANMSLGGSFDAATNTAVQNSIASGVVYAVSAGNSSTNACTQSPAAVPEALTVGATDINDNRASFSNFGTCLDLFGPGVNITAGWIGSNTATATISGTSMSSPHVAGVAGLYLAANPTATPAQVAAALVNNATSNKVGNPGTGSPNKLLYMGFIGGGGPPNMPPVADFSYTCDASLNCSFDGTLSNDPDGSIVAYAWKLANGNTVRTTSTFSRTFPNPATFDLTLEVTDNGGLTSSITKTVNVTGGGPGNMPPTASFTWNCDAARHCTFDGTGSTDDNGIVSYDWQVVGTSITRNGSTISTTFPGPKTFDLKLTVTDGGGLSDSQTQTINVP